MARPTLPPLQRQLIRIRRRLFAQGLLDSLIIGWTAALVVTAGWFAAQPYFLPSALPGLRWIVAGSILVVATAVSIALAALRRPSGLNAALAADERFGLKERITTSLTLNPADASSSAAVALLEDVNQRVAKLEIPEKFPVRLRRSAWMVPLAGAALALIAVFYKPAIVTPKAVADQQLTNTPAVKEDLEKRMEQLRKKAQEKRADDKDRSAELQRLDAELEKISRSPRDTKDDARDIIKDLTGIEEQIKKRQQELAQHAEALKEQMKQASRLSKNNNSEGPGKELAQALDRGDVQKAKEEFEKLGNQLKAEQESERLRKKLDEEGLSKEEREKIQQKIDQLKSQRMSKEDREKLKKDMKDVKNKLQRLARTKQQKEKELRDKADKGEMDQQQMQKELDDLEKDAGQLTDKDREDIQDAADKIDQAEKSLEQGNDGEAAQQLEDAAGDLQSLDREHERQELAEKMEDCEDCKGAMDDVLGGGQPVPAAGRRRESKDTVTNSVEKRERVNMDKGKLRVLDTVPGEGFKGPRKPAELTEEIRRASQEAPEAIDRQRLPRAAGDMAKGYFEKLRNERDKK
jgi:DNA repair exonuclease SbcCD ATPase subunit